MCPSNPRWIVHNRCSLFINIITWHYNPLWGFAFSAKSLQVLLSLAASFQFLTLSFFRSSTTSSCHRCLDFPTGLFPTILNFTAFVLLRCIIRFQNIQPAILDWDFIAKFVFSWTGFLALHPSPILEDQDSHVACYSRQYKFPLPNTLISPPVPAVLFQFTSNPSHPLYLQDCFRLFRILVTWPFTFAVCTCINTSAFVIGHSPDILLSPSLHVRWLRVTLTL